jgi:hypothetical protein
MGRFALTTGPFCLRANWGTPKTAPELLEDNYKTFTIRPKSVLRDSPQAPKDKLFEVTSSITQLPSEILSKFPAVSESIGRRSVQGLVLRTAIENALAGLLTKRVWMSPSVKRAARKAGMNALKTVSNGRNEPPRGSPTWYQPAS